MLGGLLLGLLESFGTSLAGRRVARRLRLRVPHPLPHRAAHRPPGRARHGACVSAERSAASGRTGPDLGVGSAGRRIAVLAPFVDATPVRVVDLDHVGRVVVMLAAGLEHRRRLLRPARPGLRRLLRDRRLHQRRAGHPLRPAAAGHGAHRARWSPCWPASSSAAHPAAAQRLPGHRDARVRRDHPDHREQPGRSPAGPSGIYGIPELDRRTRPVRPRPVLLRTVVVVALAILGASRLGRSPGWVEPGASCGRTRTPPRPWACTPTGSSSPPTSPGAIWGGPGGHPVRRAALGDLPGELHVPVVRPHPHGCRARRHGLHARASSSARS